jgi:hypothetical protein
MIDQLSSPYICFPSHLQDLPSQAKLASNHEIITRLSIIMVLNSYDTICAAIFPINHLLVLYSTYHVLICTTITLEFIKNLISWIEIV